MARSTNEASVASTSMLKKPMVAAVAIGYYGGQMHQFIDRIPTAPTMLHFGAENPMISFSTWKRWLPPILAWPFTSTRVPTTGWTAMPAPPTTGLSQVGPTAHPRFLRSHGVT